MQGLTLATFAYADHFRGGEALRCPRSFAEPGTTPLASYVQVVGSRPEEVAATWLRDFPVPTALFTATQDCVCEILVTVVTFGLFMSLQMIQNKKFLFVRRLAK